MEKVVYSSCLNVLISQSARCVISELMSGSFCWKLLRAQSHLVSGIVTGSAWKMTLQPPRIRGHEGSRTNRSGALQYP